MKYKHQLANYSQTDRDAVSEVDSRDPNIIVLDGGPDPHGKGHC